MKRKLAALFMACVLTVSAAVGCGKGTEGKGSDGDGGQQGETEEQGETGEGQEQEGSGETADSEPDEIVVRFLCGNIPEDLKLVEDAINAISIPEINVKISYEAVSAANYQNQISLDMTGGEKLDVFFLPPNSFSSMVSSNQLLDLTPYLDEYGQNIKDEVTEPWLEAFRVGDGIYATPDLCGKASSIGIHMRTDILEKYGFAPSYEMHEDYMDGEMQATLDDIEKIFETVKANEPDMVVCCLGDTGTLCLEKLINYDTLDNQFGVLMGNEGWEVVNLFETEEYKAVLQRLRDWYQKGYIKSDAATDTEGYNTYMRAGRMFSAFRDSEIGIEVVYKNDSGYDYTCIKIKTPLITSSTLTGLAWGIASTTEKPVAAVKFLNLCYGNKDIENLMCYGVEGVHWQYSDEGTIEYADGLAADTSGYPMDVYWEMPNNLLADAQQGMTPDYNQILRENNRNAKTSRALGFAFNEEPVKAEMAAVRNVWAEYSAGLLTGSLDLEANYQTFLDKMESAGLSKIIEEKQKQLDAWREANGR